MLENNLIFLEETFKQYYFDHFNLIRVPDRFTVDVNEKSTF